MIISKRNWENEIYYEWNLSKLSNAKTCNSCFELKQHVRTLIRWEHLSMNVVKELQYILFFCCTEAYIFFPEKGCITLFWLKIIVTSFCICWHNFCSLLLNTSLWCFSLQWNMNIIYENKFASFRAVMKHIKFVYKECLHK